jgi:hypothetical protein
MSSGAAMDDLHGKQLEQQLRDVEHRLVRDHGDVPVKAVHDWVQQEQARFANARVHSFISVLVERAVRSKLRQRVPVR